MCKGEILNRHVGHTVPIANNKLLVFKTHKDKIYTFEILDDLTINHGYMQNTNPPYLEAKSMVLVDKDKQLVAMTDYVESSEYAGKLW